MKFFLAILVAVAACIAIPAAQSQSVLNFNCTGAGRIPVEGSCRAFYLCAAEGLPGVLTACSPFVAPYFDPNTRTCVVNGTGCIELTTTTTTEAPEFKCPDGEFGKIPVPGNCRDFYECSETAFDDGKVVRYTCPLRRAPYFDPATGSCVTRRQRRCKLTE